MIFLSIFVNFLNKMRANSVEIKIIKNGNIIVWVSKKNSFLLVSIIEAMMPLPTLEP